MPTAQDQSRTHQILETPLALQAELGVSLRQADGRRYYQLENTLTGQFFRLGIEEWQFASRLHLGATPAQILATIKTSLSPAHAASVCQFLVDNGLVERDVPSESTPVGRPAGFKPLVSLLYRRVPLVSPDRWLDRAMPKLRFLFSSPAFIAWCCLVAAGAYCLWGQRGRFAAESQAYLFPTTWWSLLAIWLGLKVVHELGHAVVCKKYGGTVGTAGVMLILLSPVAYVDVTSSWRFRSKWQRIATSAAGMYIEFAIAAIAAIVWATSDMSEAAYLAHHVVFAAGVSTVLFNANPLMRFDGYYMLVDWLDVQNLYTRGVLAMRSLGRSLLGLPSGEVMGQGRYPYLPIVYGALSWCWRITMCLSLMLAASQMFAGAGILLAAIGALVWFGVPLFQTMRLLVREAKAIAWPRVMVLVAVGFVLLLALNTLPVPQGISVPAVVDYGETQVVRADANGFVTAVLVQTGQHVQPGDVLLEIRDDEALAELKQVQLSIRSLEIESRVRLQNDEVSEYQADLEEIIALRRREGVLRKVAEGLQVRADSAGVVLDHHPQELVGQYVQEGAATLTLADEGHKEILLSIPEHHVDQLLLHRGGDATLRLRGRLGKSVPVTLRAVEPSASDRPPSPHLLALHGGPLPVALGGEAEEEDQEPRLIAPRFRGTVAVAAPVAATLHAGQIGTVRFHDRSETPMVKLWRHAEAWFDRKLQN